MIRLTKKICMVGCFAVGKTALLRRFVSSIFSDEYLSTVGVKISKKQVETDEGAANLILWDLEGRDTYGDVNLAYLSGSSGLILVADGTRAHSLQDALNLLVMVFDMVGPIPYTLLINKDDLRDEWEIGEFELNELKLRDVPFFTTSAKSGHNVENVFVWLTRQMLLHPTVQQP